MTKPALDDAFWASLADHNPIGIQLTADDARHWFDLVWLKYSTYRYKNHKRAIISWWSRVREEEIESARERAARIVDEAETARLEMLAEDHAHKRVVNIDHFRRLVDAD